jgi:predicted signal transduction protein with EAL and GGDEF domain
MPRGDYGLSPPWVGATQQRPGDADDAAIVRSTIELAHNLGLQLVAEGVEDQETLELLASLSCDLAQGYHLARPIPADELASMLLLRLPRVPFDLEKLPRLHIHAPTAWTSSREVGPCQVCG